MVCPILNELALGTHGFVLAWKVDFNQTVASFKTLLDGTRGLVDFCLTSPYESAPKLLFTSSVSVFKGTPTANVTHDDKLMMILTLRIQHFRKCH